MSLHDARNSKDSFCKHCGNELSLYKITADHYEDEVQIYNRYNTFTGEEQFVVKVECPKYKWWIPFSKHTNYIDSKLIED